MARSKQVTTPKTATPKVGTSASDPAALDAADPLAAKRALYALPPGMIYLDGNSLGPPTAAAKQRAMDAINQWDGSLIAGWNRHGWMDLPTRVGDRIAALIGAEPGSVVACDTTSVNIFKVLAASLALKPDRRVILAETTSFPTDLYVAEGVVSLARDAGGRPPVLKLVPPEDIASAVDETTAVVLLSDIDYRSGARRDIAAITRAAHEAGALMAWDLCHSAGCLPVDLAGASADFAMGCSYKYLNGGPGAPAWVYVAPRHMTHVKQPLSGWLGHAAPFRFEQTYRPAPGIERMIAGTPSVIALSVLDAALDAFDGLDLGASHKKSMALADLFHDRVAAACPELVRGTPTAQAERGCQLAYHHPNAYAVVQALIARGVVGDFREPNIARFGFAALYLSYTEAARAADILVDIMTTAAWQRPEYAVRAKVT
jgi:kynureninase